MSMERRYRFNCLRCFFTINDEQAMKGHCLREHGITGQFKKGYKTIITRVTRVKKEQHIKL